LHHRHKTQETAPARTVLCFYRFTEARFSRDENTHTAAAENAHTAAAEKGTAVHVHGSGRESTKRRGPARPRAFYSPRPKKHAAAGRYDDLPFGVVGWGGVAENLRGDLCIGPW